METFGKWLKAKRTRRGYSQRQLGTLAGTTGSNISRIEAGKHTPGTDTIVALAIALQESPQEALSLATNRRVPRPDDTNLDAIIEMYAALPQEGRAAARILLRAMVVATERGEPVPTVITEGGSVGLRQGTTDNE